jgi:hypothetical protein
LSSWTACPTVHIEISSHSWSNAVRLSCVVHARPWKWIETIYTLHNGAVQLLMVLRSSGAEGWFCSSYGDVRQDQGGIGGKK